MIRISFYYTCCAGIAAIVLYSMYTRVTNIDMTDMRLFATYGHIYVLIIPLIFAAAFLHKKY